MSKTICKTTDSDKLEKKQEKPNFRCKRCGETATKAKHLCKPESTNKS